MRVQFTALVWDSEKRKYIKKSYDMNSEEILKSWYVSDEYDLPSESDSIESCYIDGEEREDITKFRYIIEWLNLQFWNER